MKKVFVLVIDNDGVKWTIEYFDKEYYLCRDGERQDCGRLSQMLAGLTVQVGKMEGNN